MSVFLISGFFILIALIMNEKNAKFLLAGYNTMSEEKRKNYNIRGFLKVFRLSFMITGVGIPLFWYFLTQAGYTDFAGWIVMIGPLFVVIFVIIQGQRFYSEKSKSAVRTSGIIAIGIMGIVLISVILLFYFGLKENTLTMSDNYIAISGMYGEIIPCSEITGVEITDRLPALSARTNGFAFNKHLKGYFRTKNGQQVKLFVDAGHPEYLKIISSSRVYFWNSDTEDIENIYSQIKSRIK